MLEQNALSLPLNDWEEKAACASPGPVPVEAWTSPELPLVAAAKRVCAGCPVLAECEAWTKKNRRHVQHQVRAGRWYGGTAGWSLL